MLCVSIDIGSTWTKGAVFSLIHDDLVLLERRACPTTVDDLARGFNNVLMQLLPTASLDELLALIHSGEVELSYSSSAKGGLAVAALGLVPDITLETAKMAAYSAGAKLTQVLSYKLTSSDVRALEAAPPDILLFAGGTDGGNTDYVLTNARTLAASKLNCAMVYAGNRSVRDEVSELLAHKDFIAVDNLLPCLDEPNPEPAREALRAIFLARIVKGKGLDRIIAATGIEPWPTPYAVVEYAKAIREHVPGWHEFVLLDMGGATTDVYSAHRESPTNGTVLRGLPEPDVKRTVEGDLGMRVSAAAAAESGQGLIRTALANDPARLQAFNHYVARVAAQPDHLPQDETGQQFDALLAGACVAHACARHAGRSYEVYTPDGLVRVQLGRDLSKVHKVIGSGGWLSKVDGFNPSHWLAQVAVDAKGKAVLVPTQIHYHRDADYLFPLLANVAQAHPAAAARAGVQALVAANESKTLKVPHGTEQPAFEPG
ncbi:MAG: methylaspartate mutase accessory protein GlmL [Burkholderiales bacterium]